MNQQSPTIFLLFLFLRGKSCCLNAFLQASTLTKFAKLYIAGVLVAIVEIVKIGRYHMVRHNRRVHQYGHFRVPLFRREIFPLVLR